MERREKDYVWQRAELLAQLFLQELGASVWGAVLADKKGPFDAIASFVTDDQKSRITAIEVKPTEQPVGKEFRFQEKRKAIRALQHSNVPVLFLIVDVKRNQLFYGWATDVRYDAAPSKGKDTVRCTLPVIAAGEDKQHLLDTILSQPEFSECVGAG
jgi:hypothetical protein